MNQKRPQLKLDKFDRLILNRIQKDFPVCENPYQALALQLRVLRAEEILERVIRLKKSGLIRRFGPIIDSRKVKYASTLIAMEVPNHCIKDVYRKINAFDSVTHNYLRNGLFNLWFTLTAENQLKLNKLLEEIKKKTKIKKILNLPVVRTFKIGLNLKV